MNARRNGDAAANGFRPDPMPGWRLEPDELRDLTPPADVADPDDPAAWSVYAYLTLMWARCDRPLSLWEAYQLERLVSAPETCVDREKLTADEWAELQSILARDADAAEAEASEAAAIFRAEADAAATAPRPPVPVLLDYFADRLADGDERLTGRGENGRRVGLIAWDDGDGTAGTADAAPLTPADAERVRAHARDAARALAADPAADLSALLADDGAEVLWVMMRADHLDALPASTFAELKARIWGPRAAEVERRQELTRKGLLTDAERVAERAALGLANVPSLSESLADADVPDDERRDAVALLLHVAGAHLADEHVPPPDDDGGTPAGRWLRADRAAQAAEADAWDALTRRVVDAEERARLAELEAKAARDKLAAADAERAKRQRAIGRQGTGLLRALMHRDADMEKAERFAAKNGVAALSGHRLAARIEPLGWAERLVVHGLVSLAHEEGKLDSHPWAVQRRPMVTENPAPRVRTLFPGWAELARAAGVETDGGRLPKERRQPLATALVNLAREDRWIPQPVRVPTGERERGEDGQWRAKYVDDVHATREKWVVMGGTVVTRRVTLDIHPVAVVSHLVSYVEVGNLAARYEAARRAIGKRQMRDEWAALDDYLRYLASVNVGAQRGRDALAAKRDAEPPAARMVTVGDLRITKDVDDSTLRVRGGLLGVAQKRGEAEAAARMADALAFCQAMGTLTDYRRERGKEGQRMWRLTLAHPDVHRSDPAQGLLVLPPGADLPPDDGETAAEAGG